MGLVFNPQTPISCTENLDGGLRLSGRIRRLEWAGRPTASLNGKRGRIRRLQGTGQTLTMLEAFSLAGVGVSVAAMKALKVGGLEDGQEAARTQGYFVFVQKSYTQNFTLPNQKKIIYIYIYNIYLTNVRKTSAVQSSPVSLR